MIKQIIFAPLTINQINNNLIRKVAIVTTSPVLVLIAIIDNVLIHLLQVLFLPIRVSKELFKDVSRYWNVPSKNKWKVFNIIEIIEE